MIKQQLRAGHVLNEDVLALARRLPREQFVPESSRVVAYADLRIPLAHQQCMMTPTTEALIVQALNITRTDRVLEIGTGSGYLTALLASLSQSVCSVDIYPEFTQTAAQKLQQFNLNNVQLATADGAQGWQLPTCYDVVVVTGSLPEWPQVLSTQLAEQGRLFAIVGSSPVMEATLITRRGDGFSEQILFETDFPPLLLKTPEVFHF